MGEKGLISLKHLLQNIKPAQLEFVMSARDKGMINDFYDEIKNVCVENSVKFYDKNDSFKQEADYGIAIGWKWLIKNEKSLIVFHDSILPRYRGYAPLVSSLINNEKQLGVTAIIATEEYDKGDIIAQLTTSITYPIKIQYAIELVANLYANLLVSIFHKIAENGTIEKIKQNESNASYSIWRDEEDYYIDWNKSAEYIKRFVDAVGYPYKGATTNYDGETVIINDCEVVEDINFEIRDAGKVFKIIDGCPYVICEVGILKINNVIRYNSKDQIFPFNKVRTRFHK